MSSDGLWVAFMRHGPTAWNAAGRIQGHTDIPLSGPGREAVARRRIPAHYQQARWVSSPMTRAMQTADLLGCKAPDIEACLKEMNWGQWEGRTLAQLRRQSGNRMLENERRGLDFRPAGGESPRQVRHRVAAWLQRAARGRRPCVAVTHKGVIRTVLSLATGWDMTCGPPIKLRWHCAHEFWLNRAGEVSVREMNIDL